VIAPLAARLLDDDTGLSSRAEHRCAACGYGIIVSDPVPACPMCQTNTWDPVTREPLAHPDRPGRGAVVDELAARRLLPRPVRARR
jgi:hypothetical protein